MLKRAELRSATRPEDYDTGMGMMALLGATSAFGAFTLTRAVGVLHCALKNESFRIYLGSNNRPSAAVIWAFLDQSAADEYVSKGFLADSRLWNSGDQLWFLSVIADGKKIRHIIDDALSDPMFAEHDIGYMLRANEEGKRRVVGFTRTGIKLIRTLT